METRNLRFMALKNKCLGEVQKFRIGFFYNTFTF